MNSVELAKLVDLSDQTILDMRSDPFAPAMVAGKFPREPWLKYIAGVKMYGRKAMKLHGQGQIETEAAKVQTGPTGNVDYPPGESPIEKDDGTSTTTDALLDLPESRLLKNKLAEEILTRRIANQERRGRLVPRAIVEEVFFARAQSALGLARKLRLELPPKLLGLDRPDLEAVLTTAFDEFFARIAALGDPIGATPAPAEPAPPVPPVPPAPDAQIEKT